MATLSQLPPFASAKWYTDYNDYRCPHDAWLETLEIAEPATGQRGELRSTTITVRLLGAYHDGHIVFRYLAVQSYTLAAPSATQGLGDWLKDELSLNPAGFVVRRIDWFVHGRLSQATWTIECREVTYEWIPKS